MLVDKDNIYVIPQTSTYFANNLVDGYMDNDFTLNIVLKLNIDELQMGKESFLFSRNGMHSGLSIYKHTDTYHKFNPDPNPDLWRDPGPPNSIIFIQYTYWFKNLKTNSYEKKTLQYILKEAIIRKTNVYTMVSDDDSKKIFCYFNYELVGTINYEGYEKVKYKGSYYWFGCDNMITDSLSSISFSNYDLQFIFLAKKKIDIEEVKYISKNYKKIYTDEFADVDLKILSKECPYKNDFAFLCDFKNITRYKVWNYVFNGIYPIRYMPNNTHF